MTRKMSRGMQQVLLNYLPGKTFDFEKAAVIARVERIRGVARTDLNLRLILRTVERQARAWSDEFRPLLRDIESSPDRFVLVEPRALETVMYPLVFWCQNPRCGVVVQSADGIPNAPTCSTCRTGRLVQLRFVKVHRCGAIEPLVPYDCSRCHARHRIALDTRGSERISEFQWVCRSCGFATAVFAGRCRACTWPGDDPSLKNMSVEVHRAGRTFYGHNAVLLNHPSRELSSFLGLPRWEALAASAFFGLPEMHGRRLIDLGLSRPHDAALSPFTLSDDERSHLIADGLAPELVEQFERMQAQLAATRSRSEAATSPQGVAESLLRRSGVPWAVWEHAGQEMLEAVLPTQSGNAVDLFQQGGDAALAAQRTAARVGVASVILATDFPITTATFAFTRTDYQPDACRLNPFPPDRDHGGRFPVFVDTVDADAILLRLDHDTVLEWLTHNGHTPGLPRGEDSVLARRAFFTQLLDGLRPTETIPASHPEARMVFGLLHTMSHLALRRASFLCGLEGPSLSEYVLPRALTFALYCNHRFGATIGALASLFEQSLPEWLSTLQSTRLCVYDPVCRDSGGSCHACSHLSETSCRFFNVNLGRAFLFGGPDPLLGEIRTGYLDLIGSR